MLVERLRTSAILILIAVTLVVLDGTVTTERLSGIWLLPLLAVAAVGTAWEMVAMLRAAGHPIRRGVAIGGAAVVSFSAVVPLLWVFSENGYPQDCPVGRLGWIPISGVLTIFGILLSEMRYYNREIASLEDGAGEDVADKGTIAGETIQRTCSAAFVSMYVGLPMAMLGATRQLHAEATSGMFGLAALITLIAVTKVTDAGAFFSGRALGRNKLVPSLSPAKTVEGAIGGIVSATLAAYLCLTFLFPWFLADAVDNKPNSAADVTTGLAAILASPIWGAIVLGPSIAISAMVGDLAESLIKRDSGVKDSGDLLPGLGGVWDVTDSLIAASVPAFFCFAAGVGGQ